MILAPSSHTIPVANLLVKIARRKLDRLKLDSSSEDPEQIRELLVKSVVLLESISAKAHDIVLAAMECMAELFNTQFNSHEGLLNNLITDGGVDMSTKTVSSLRLSNNERTHNDEDVDLVPKQITNNRPLAILPTEDKNYKALVHVNHQGELVSSNSSHELRLSSRRERESNLESIRYRSRSCSGSKTNPVKTNLENLVLDTSDHETNIFDGDPHRDHHQDHNRSLLNVSSDLTIVERSKLTIADLEKSNPILAIKPNTLNPASAKAVIYYYQFMSIEQRIYFEDRLVTAYSYLWQMCMAGKKYQAAAILSEIILKNAILNNEKFRQSIELNLSSTLLMVIQRKLSFLDQQGDPGGVDSTTNIDAAIEFESSSDYTYLAKVYNIDTTNDTYFNFTDIIKVYRKGKLYYLKYNKLEKLGYLCKLLGEYLIKSVPSKENLKMAAEEFDQCIKLLLEAGEMYFKITAFLLCDFAKLARLAAMGSVDGSVDQTTDKMSAEKLKFLLQARSCYTKIIEMKSSEMFRLDRLGSKIMYNAMIDAVAISKDIFDFNFITDVLSEHFKSTVSTFYPADSLAKLITENPKPFLKLMKTHEQNLTKEYKTEISTAFKKHFLSEIIKFKKSGQEKFENIYKKMYQKYLEILKKDDSDIRLAAFVYVVIEGFDEWEEKLFEILNKERQFSSYCEAIFGSGARIVR